MYPTCRLEVVTLSRFKPSYESRANALVYPGELFPGSKGLFPNQAVGAAVKFEMDTAENGSAKLMCKLVLKTFFPDHKYHEIPKATQENLDKIVLMITKKGYFLMEKECAHELEQIGSVA
jgi:hypothetical protein